MLRIHGARVEVLEAVAHVAAHQSCLSPGCDKPRRVVSRAAQKAKIFAATSAGSAEMILMARLRPRAPAPRAPGQCHQWRRSSRGPGGRPCGARPWCSLKNECPEEFRGARVWRFDCFDCCVLFKHDILVLPSGLVRASLIVQQRTRRGRARRETQNARAAPRRRRSTASYKQRALEASRHSASRSAKWPPPRRRCPHGHVGPPHPECYARRVAAVERRARAPATDAPRSWGRSGGSSCWRSRGTSRIGGGARATSCSSPRPETNRGRRRRFRRRGRTTSSRRSARGFQAPPRRTMTARPAVTPSKPDAAARAGAAASSADVARGSSRG